MTRAQVNLTLGTAGHIDHGKTALVRSLTGCETDRLKEEKERGMSIDLGYAPCKLEDLEVGICDVPGHEHFVKTMVAGAAGMDGVILVVAADDGIMPQTREHLDILTLLGIRHGMTALTKIDRVDADRLAAVRAELEGYLHGTFLDGAPILPVSNVTLAGFDQFYDALVALVRSIRPRATDGVFRMPLDRAFSAKGFGTVVAGIPTAGAARVGDEIALLPHGERGRIKRIQVYGRDSDAVKAGQCAALNVGHWEPERIGRGDVVTLPGYFAADSWWAASLRLLPHEKLLLKNGAAVKFHTGTSEVNANLFSVEGLPLEGGTERLVQLRLERPVVAGPGDPFIVRTLSPVRTVGGGTLLEATPGKIKKHRPEAAALLRERAAALGDDARFVEHCLRRAASLAATSAELAAAGKVLPGRLQAILAQLVAAGRAAALSASLYAHADTIAEAGGRILATLREHHRQTPESPGLAVEQLRPVAGMDNAVLDGMLAALKAAGTLAERGGRWAAPEHRPQLQEADSKWVDAVEATFRAQEFAPPSADELVEKLKAPRAAVDKALKFLREHQRLVFVGEGLWFHCEAIDRARELLVAHLRKEGRLESVQFKYLLNTTRKFALPLLDYFDRTGLLRRSGNTRYLKTK